MTERGSTLSGEAAILYAERFGGNLRMSDVREVRPTTARTMLASASPEVRTLLLRVTRIRIQTTTPAAEGLP